MGTNSLRLLVVRLNPNHSYTILTRQKQQVRLGEGEFEDEEITPQAMERAAIVAKRFTDLARTFSSEEFVAVATSAAREASNQNELLHLLRQEAQIDIRVISGREEARLIYLGVASGMHLSDRTGIFYRYRRGQYRSCHRGRSGTTSTWTVSSSGQSGSRTSILLPGDTGPVTPGTVPEDSSSMSGM